jgi:hypothetical protein
MNMNRAPPPSTFTYSRKASKRRQRAPHSSDDDSDYSQRRSKVRIEATKPTSSLTTSDASQNKPFPPQGMQTRSSLASPRAHMKMKSGQSKYWYGPDVLFHFPSLKFSLPVVHDSDSTALASAYPRRVRSPRGGSKRVNNTSTHPQGNSSRLYPSMLY